MIGPNRITNFATFDRFIAQVPRKATSTDTKIERNPFRQPQESQTKLRQNSSSVHAYLQPESTVCHMSNNGGSGPHFILLWPNQKLLLFNLLCPQHTTAHTRECPADHSPGTRGIQHKITSVDQGRVKS